MPLFGKILIANRGEIAIRIMRSCRDLGIDSIAVYGDDEHDAPHVRYADEAYRLDSDAPIPYLDIDAVLHVAKIAQADAVHPGYGFLAENGTFARRCADAGLVWIGPPAQAIASMGDKIEARAIAMNADVPVVPGSGDAIEGAFVEAEARRIGYPVAIKAAAGGGGRGFRVANQPEALTSALEGAAGEAERYFSDGRVYIERYLEQPRHIEIQILADQHGQVVALGERDCSIQRRHQKLIEEGPSPVLDAEMRTRMEEAAIELARAVDYVGAGTVEFLVQDSEFFFLEMNTRIQVEHPVTELITGVDLVCEQIRIAAGETIEPSRFNVRHGHAIECRINAEDPAAGFQPVSGVLSDASIPAGPGVRLDGIIEPGLAVSPRYDSLLGKLLVWGRTREDAIGRMRRALSELHVRGIATTISFHQAVMNHPVFISGTYDTRFLERHPDVLEGLAHVDSGGSTSDNPVPVERSTYLIEVNGRRFDVGVYLPKKQQRAAPTLDIRRDAPAHVPDGTEQITSPIQGTVLSVAVSQGDDIRAGDVICVIEAMKMENEIAAGRDGKVTELTVEAGDSIQSGALIAVIEQNDSPTDL